VYLEPGVSGTRCIWNQVYLGPGVSWTRCIWNQVYLGPGVSGPQGPNPEEATGQGSCVMQGLMSATRRHPCSPDVSRGQDVNRL
jgi:hypothetical protein